MANLYITEYAQIGVDSISRGVMSPQEPPLAEQVVSFTTSTQSAAFNADTRLVRIHTDAACHILFGANPTATTSKQKLIAGQTQFHAVRPDQISGLKVAAVTNA